MAPDLNLLPPLDLPPRAAYKRWSSTYLSTGRNPLTTAVDRAVFAVLPPLAGRRVLDVACGDGRWARVALVRGAARAAGVDFTAEMLASARVASPDVPFAAADMRALPFPACAFDVLVHALALGHAPAPAPAIAEAARVLVRGGWLVLADLHPDAAARGWRRTFRDAHGGRHAVRWHPHAIADVLAACDAAGLRVARRVERPLDAADLRAAPPAAGGVLAVYAMAVVKR